MWTIKGRLVSWSAIQKRPEQMHVLIVRNSFTAQIYKEARLVVSHYSFCALSSLFISHGRLGRKEPTSLGKRTAWSPPRLA
jgi:hypothetical protein